MTGPKDIIIGVLVLALMGLSISAAILKSKVGKLKSDVEVYELREEKWSVELEECAVEIVDLRTAIDKQNESQEIAIARGIESQEAQEQVDRYARRLALAEDKLRDLIDDQERFAEVVRDADVCQTYELVLRDLAGEEL